MQKEKKDVFKLVTPKKWGCGESQGLDILRRRKNLVTRIFLIRHHHQHYMTEGVDWRHSVRNIHLAGILLVQWQ